MHLEVTYMNLMNLKEQLLSIGKTIGLQVQEETADSLTLHSQIIAKDYFKNSIYFKMIVYTSGTLHIFFTFDEIEKTYDNLFLINKLNAETPWFKAYIANINDKDYLEFHYALVGLTYEEEVINNFTFILNSLLEEETLKYLQPILQSKNSD